MSFRYDVLNRYSVLGAWKFQKDPGGEECLAALAPPVNNEAGPSVFSSNRSNRAYQAA